MEIVTIHASRNTEDLYLFGDVCTYDNRSEPLATVTAVYCFEGLMVDLKSYRGKSTLSTWRGLREYLAKAGAIRVEWRRDNTGIECAKAYDLINKKFIEPLFNSL